MKQNRQERKTKVEPLTARRLRKMRRNARSSGSLCLAAARDPESARAGIGPTEPEERDPRREMKVEDPRPEANGFRTETETIRESSRFPALCQAS